MRVLVTGGAGYIGSVTAHLLASRGHEVWVYDNLSRGHLDAAPAGRLLQGDLRDASRLAAVLREKRIEAVLHFAALALVGESTQRPQWYYSNNVLGSLCLLQAMQQSDVRRIVFSSTTAVYGVARQVPIPVEHPREPINPYGRTKLAVEHALADYARACEFSVVALRYFNAAGASRLFPLGEDHRPETHLIPNALQVALGQREHLTIFGQEHPTPDGTCVRDYVHVDDLARAHLAALEQLQRPGFRAYNLGSGRGASVREVVETCRRVTGRAIPVRIAPARPGDPPLLVADESLARRELDWSPQNSSLEEIVASAWHWHREHPYGYRAAPPKRPGRIE